MAICLIPEKQYISTRPDPVDGHFVVRTIELIEKKNAQQCASKFHAVDYRRDVLT